MPALAGGTRLTDPTPIDRRRFRRLLAPSVFRPAQATLFRQGPTATEAQLVGVWVLADEALTRGELLQLEVFVAAELSVTCTIEVAWLEELPRGAGAKFEIGLRFLGADKALVDRLAPAIAAE